MTQNKTNQTPDGVPEEIKQLIQDKGKEFADGMMFEPLEKMTTQGDKIMHGAMTKAAKYMGELVYRHLSQSPKGTPDESEVEKWPKQFHSIWDAFEDFDKANEEMNPMDAPVSPPALLEKNHYVVKRAATERGAVWMRKALDKRLAKQEGRIQSLTSELAKAREEGAEYRKILQRLQDNSPYENSGISWLSTDIRSSITNALTKHKPQ
jgi:hypothetical protein